MRSKLRICRLCMGYKKININVDDKIYSKIRECIQVEIDPDDANLPICICTYCVRNVRKFDAFRKECWKVQRLLFSKLMHRDFIQIVNVSNLNLPASEDIALGYRYKRKCTTRPATKKEMTIEIREVERPSPPDAIRSGHPFDPPQNLLETHDHIPVATANRLEEPKKMTAEKQPPENKAVETATPEILEQATDVSIVQTVNISPAHIGNNLECLEPESLEAASLESNVFDTRCVKTEIFESENSQHDALETEVFQLKALKREALDSEFLEPQALKHEALDTEALEPEALEPEVLEPEALENEDFESEVLEPEALEPETLESEAWEPEASKPACLKQDILKSADKQSAMLDTESHLKPHDYTTKQACSSVEASPKKRPRPRRRQTNISGKALYKSLLAACDTCGKMIERNRMEGHRNKHMGIRPYSCPHEACGAAFHCKHACRLHVRCRHGNESFCCDLCGKVYRARRDLLGHQREAHSEPKFDCDICTKKFTTRSRLKQHRFYHTGERNHPCALCAMTFFNRFQLKVHMRTHTQARPFVCKVCRKAFRYRHMAKDHIIRQHGIDESLERDWIIHHPEPDISEIMRQVEPICKEEETQ